MDGYLSMSSLIHTPHSTNILYITFSAIFFHIIYFSPNRRKQQQNIVHIYRRHIGGKVEQEWDGKSLDFTRFPTWKWLFQEISVFSLAAYDQLTSLYIPFFCSFIRWQPHNQVNMMINDDVFKAHAFFYRMIFVYLDRHLDDFRIIFKMCRFENLCK